MSEEKKGYPEGSVKTVITTLDLFKLKTKIGIGATGKGVKIVYEDGEYGSKTVKLPENKFKDKALTVPQNKKLYEELKTSFAAFEDDDEQDFTLTFVKGSEYWDFQGIQAGAVGTPGVLKPGQDAGSTGGGGASYDGSAAAKGQIRNVALELASSVGTKPKSASELLDRAIAVLEDEGFAEQYAAFMEASDEVYANLGKGTNAGQKPAEDDPTPSEAPEADEEDDDDDIPF